MQEAQTLFANIPSSELSELEENLFKTNPNAKLVRDIETDWRYHHGVQQDLLGAARTLLSPLIFHSSQRPHFKNPKPTVTQPMGTLYQILQLQVFPWIINGVHSIPLHPITQLLAIPINNESEPFDLSNHQIQLCSQVKTLFHCDFSSLDIRPNILYSCHSPETILKSQTTLWLHSLH